LREVNEMPEIELVAITKPRSLVAEAYRTLRTNIEFASKGNIKTIEVVSPEPDREKSVAVANLAAVTAQSGKKVLLVDADMRRPSQHEIFGLKNDAGLSSLLQKGAPLEALWQESGVDNLYVLTSGPITDTNPADLIDSPRMDEVISFLKENAEVVFFDAPPVIAVADASLLAAKVDGVLIAIRAGKTKREHAQQTKSFLEKAQANILGAFLLDAQGSVGLQGYY
jgi:capsular exopolysaccharide synthesis family protein